MHQLAIKNGTLVGPDNAERKDIYIGDGLIQAIVEPGVERPAREVVDASGSFILPGLIDGHVHFREPGFPEKEGVLNGSLAAAAGGVTTTIVMATDNPMTSSLATFEEKKWIGRKSYVDYALNGIVGWNTDEIAGLARAGCCVFDIFFGDVPTDYLVDDPSRLLGVLRAVAEVGGVAGITPTLGSIVAWQMTQQSNLPDPLKFAASRPPVSETIGVAIACEAAIASGCRIHLRQISCRQSVELIAHYKGVRPGLITAETLPHNLVLDEGHLERFWPNSKMSPPLRGAEHSDALMAGLRNHTIDVIVTDHAPHLLADKQAEDVWKIASGIPGLETFLPSLLGKWGQGEISLSEIVRWTADAPADIFGLSLQKGRVAEGYDADLVVVEDAVGQVVDVKDMVSRAQYTPFVGYQYRGRISHVLCRGAFLKKQGQVLGAEPGGRFIRSVRN